MAFIQPVASRSVGVIQYSYSSALSIYNDTSQTYGPVDRTSRVIKQRLQELHNIGLLFRDFIENEFLWEWSSLTTNCSMVGDIPTVFAASFALPARSLETIIVVNAVATSQSVAVVLKNDSHVNVMLQPLQVVVARNTYGVAGAASNGSWAVLS
jgi:hypothetical protein